MGNLNFDSTNITPSAPLETLPAGTYPCKIADTEIKETKSGSGKYLQITLDVLDPQYKGRKLFDRLNLWNQNQQAVDIANRTLSAICHATGIMQPRNHEEFRGKSLNVKVTIDKDPSYGDRNEVKGYSATEGSAPVQAAMQNVAASGAKPW